MKSTPLVLGGKGLHVGGKFWKIVSGKMVEAGYEVTHDQCGDRGRKTDTWKRLLEGRGGKARRRGGREGGEERITLKKIKNVYH